MIPLYLALATAIASGSPVHIPAAERAFKTGQALAQAGNFIPAEKEFDNAIAIEPDYMDAYDALARAQLNNRQLDQAGRTLSRLLQIYPKSAVHRVLLGNLLLSLQESARALAQFSFALKQDPGDADALAGFAVAAQAQGLRDKAAAAIARGQRLYPSDTRFETENARQK